MTFKKILPLAVLLLGTKMSMGMDETQIMRRQAAARDARRAHCFMGFSAGFLANVISGRHPCIRNTAGLAALGLGHGLETRLLTILSKGSDQEQTQDATYYIEQEEKACFQIALAESKNRWALARCGVSFAVGAGAALATRKLLAIIYSWLTRPKAPEAEPAQQ